MNILIIILLFIPLTTYTRFDRERENISPEEDYAQQHSEPIKPSVEKPWNIQSSLQYFKGDETASMLYQTDITYSFQSNLALELFVPIYLKNKFESFVSRGVGDSLVNVQWVPWKNDIQTFVIIGGVKFPTGDTHKVPVTGTGNYAFNLTFASYHASDAWDISFLLNTLANLPRKGYLVGNAYNYQFSLAKQIIFNDKIRITLGGQLFGIYLQPDRFLGDTISNTGGHVLYLGPVVTFQYKDLQLQILHQGVVSQYLFGTQHKNQYTTLFACTYNF